MRTGLLMLPIATVSGFISIIDALFTTTSAVCVTRLIVVDVGKFFTLFGQRVILVLIQLGDLESCVELIGAVLPASSE